MGTFAGQQLLIIIYRLPTKENKLPFSVSVCNKQTEVCRFCILLAANKRNYLYIIDGQVRLIRLQMNKFRLCLRKQTDKRQASVCK
jgi:hypothetical protein